MPALALVVLWLLLMGSYIFLSLQQFKSGNFRGDFAAIWQSVYNTASSGKPLSSFNISVHEYWSCPGLSEMNARTDQLDRAHQLGIHAHFYTYPLAGIYKIFPGASTLLVVQAITYIGLFAFLAVIGLRKGVPVVPLALTGILFAYSPFSLGLILNDFHFDALAGIAIGYFALHFLDKECSWRSLLLWGFATVLIKESFVGLVAGAGLALLAGGAEQRVRGLALIGFAISAYLALTKIVIPHYSFYGHFMFDGIYGSTLGSSMGEIVTHALTQPGKLIEVLSAKSNSDYLLILALTTPITALLAPRALLLCAAFLFVNLVTGNIAMKLPWGQYSAVLTCSGAVAAVNGQAKLADWSRRRGFRNWQVVALASASLLPTAWFCYVHLPLRTQVWQEYLSGAEQASLSSIPKSSSVTADDTMANFIADREKVYLFPMGLYSADWVLTRGNQRPFYLNEENWRQAQKYILLNFETVQEREGLYLARRIAR